MQSAFNSSVFIKVTLAIEQIIRVDVSDLSEATSLAGDLAISHFGRLKLAVCLEEIFDIELQNNAVEQFDTLGDIVSYLSYRYFRDIDPSAQSIAA